MIKNLNITLICLILVGCSFNQYTLTYNDALKKGIGVSILKSDINADEKEKIAGFIESRGYKKLVFADSKQTFFVYSKDSDFNLSSQIILKYVQKQKDNKVRIDLVSGSDDLVLLDEIQNDIKAIAQSIKND